MEEIFNERLNQAKKGRIYWNSLVDKYKIETKQYVLLLYTEDFEYAAYAIYNADAFMKSKEAENMLVLTDCPKVCNLAKKKMKGLIASLIITKVEMDNLLALYCLYEYTDRLIIAGAEEVLGRTGNSLIGKKGISKEEFVKLTLYNLT